MKKRSFRFRGTALAGWILVPGVLLCHLFPLLLTFGYAVTRSAFDRQFVALENFRYLFSNRFFRLGSANLLLLGALALALGLTVILLLGFLLSRHPHLLRRGMVLLLLPLLIPSVSAVSVWQAVFRTNTLLPASDARAALLTLFLWQHTGVGALLLALALRALPGEMLDAAALDGAGACRTFFCVQLPNTAAALAMDGVLLFMFFLRVFKESYLLFGPYPSEDVYLLQHYMNHQYQKMNFQYVAASAVLLVAPPSLGYLALGRVLRHGVRYDEKRI